MMFKSAHLRLTLLYCAIFFAIFWAFSGGLYFWMSRSFGDNYVNQVTQTENEHSGSTPEKGANEHTAEAATIAGDITLNQLRTVLLSLNGILCVLVPTAAWLLTERSLRPVRRAYEQQRNFVSDASHELRTPLTIIRGELDLALKKKRRSSDYRAALDTTRTEVTRLQRLVDDLLLLAQDDNPERTLATGAVDVTALLADVVARLQPYAVAHGVTLQLQPHDQTLTLRGSRLMLERLFENVISNAIKYSRTEGTVTVSLGQKAHSASITVTDSGIGMSKVAAERAFDRFYRESESRTEGGFGLGLAISKSITVRHGGTIHIDSAPGLGTTVTVTLPLHT